MTPARSTKNENTRKTHGIYLYTSEANKANEANKTGKLTMHLD